jgi:hypothetical protein
MSKKIFVWLLATLLLETVDAEAQQPKKMPRIGYLAGDSHDAFRQGLKDLGYLEGRVFSSSGDIQRTSRIVFLSLRPNWFVSRLM